ncbi:MAG: GspMb/PilO family protein [Thermodesulfovibrionia bacterium]|nr:GspMb/PilO family protein [Thermodesulfovibrionia bacterium]
MNLPFRVSAREKRVFITGTVLAVLIIIYWITGWYGDIKTEMADLTDAKQMMLQKQMKNLSDMGLLQEKLDNIKQSASTGQKSLLNGNKPPVAAAELQSILKDMLTSLQIDMKSERTLAAVDAGYYLGVPVEIGFISDTEKLKGFLYRLRVSALLLNVTDLKARVTNANNPEDTYITLVITGFIKKPADEEAVKKEK